MFGCVKGIGLIKSAERQTLKTVHLNLKNLGSATSPVRALIHVCVWQKGVSQTAEMGRKVFGKKGCKEQCGYDCRQGHICDTQDTKL